MDTLTKYQLMNRAFEENRTNTDALCSICSIMDFQGLTPETFDVQSKRPEGISEGSWANMVKRFWKENYNG